MWARVCVFVSVLRNFENHLPLFHATLVNFAFRTVRAAASRGRYTATFTASRVTLHRAFFLVFAIVAR